MVNKKQTSKDMGSGAGRILQDENSSAIQKKLAASVLRQTSTNAQTWDEMEKIASDVLKSDKYSDKTKSLAASLIAQSNKNR